MSRRSLLPAVRGVLVLLILLAVASAWRALPVSAWVERAMTPIREAGAWGALVYIVLYVVGVVLLVPGSAITLAAGYLYGPVIGTVLVSAASTLGALASFAIARTVARRKVRRWLEGDPRFEAVDRAVADRGAWVVLLLRLNPSVPYNVLNYALGLTGIGFVPYFIASWLGMLPGTIAFVVVGAAFGLRGHPGGLGPRAWAAIVVTTVAATVLLGWLARDALAPEPSQEP